MNPDVTKIDVAAKEFAAEVMVKHFATHSSNQHKTYIYSWDELSALLTWTYKAGAMEGVSMYKHWIDELS